jgi:hypothetical protein
VRVAVPAASVGVRVAVPAASVGVGVGVGVTGPPDPPILKASSKPVYLHP